MDYGHIQPSASLCASLAFIIQKIDTFEIFRVTNYQAINKSMIKKPPKWDVQIEVVNHVLVHALHNHSGCRNKWDNYFSILQHSYKKATHSAKGFSHFKVFLCFQPTSPAELALTLDPHGTSHQHQEKNPT